MEMLREITKKRFKKNTGKCSKKIEVDFEKKSIKNIINIDSKKLDDSEEMLKNIELMEEIVDNLKVYIQKDIKENGINNKNVDSINNSSINIEREDFYKEIETMKEKINCSIPKVTIVYIIASSMALMFFAFSFIITIFMSFYIMNPFISFISSIGSLGLLITAIVSLKDWRRFLKNGK
jgi:hypothetical protein